MKLINNGPSSFGRKVMVALLEKNIPFDVEWDVPWHDDTVVDTLNPLEQLPILVTDAGEVVYESSFIIEWLDSRFPQPLLTPEDPELRLEMGRFRVLAVGVMNALLLANFEYARPPGQQSAAWADRQLRKVKGGLSVLNTLVTDRPFVVGDHFSLADIELGCVLAHLDFIADKVPPLKAFFSDQIRWREDCPSLSRYTDDIVQRPSFLNSTPFMVDINFSSVVA